MNSWCPRSIDTLELARAAVALVPSAVVEPRLRANEYRTATDTRIRVAVEVRRRTDFRRDLFRRVIGSRRFRSSIPVDGRSIAFDRVASSRALERRLSETDDSRHKSNNDILNLGRSVAAGGSTVFMRDNALLVVALPCTAGSYDNSDHVRDRLSRPLRRLLRRARTDRTHPRARRRYRTRRCRYHRPRRDRGITARRRSRARLR